MDKSEQDGYEMEVAETKEALRAEVSEVCRHYCLYVWNEALKQVEAEASFALRKVESVYYPHSIRTSSFSGSKADTASKEADAGKDNSAKTLLSSNSLSKKVGQPEVAEEEANITTGVASDATQPPAAPKDPSKEKVASHNMKIVLVTLTLPTKEDLKKVKAQHPQLQLQPSLPRSQRKISFFIFIFYCCFCFQTL